MAERIGFIGLGIMGRPMALNLARAGFKLWVYARRAESVAPLVAAGAQACTSPADVARNATIVVTMVSDTPDVQQVILGVGGVIEGAAGGHLVIDMSTISPSATRAIAEALEKGGIDMLDAPVSGGEQGAIDGNLSIMVGGPERCVERARPLLKVMGRNLVHVGEQNGAGQIVKACNQVVVANTIAGVAEAMILARAAGVDPNRMREALLGGFANSRVLEVHGQRMIDRDFEPGFKARLHQKDMRIVLEAAHEMGVALPGSALCAQHLNALVGLERGELDSSAVYNVLERTCGSEET